MSKVKYDLLTTEDFYIAVAIGQKMFDFRKKHLDLEIGDWVRFVEADELGIPTGRACEGKVNFVLHSREFPKHFGWTGPEFTIFQFDIHYKFRENVKNES